MPKHNGAWAMVLVDPGVQEDVPKVPKDALMMSPVRGAINKVWVHWTE